MRTLPTRFIPAVFKGAARAGSTLAPRRVSSGTRRGGARRRGGAVHFNERFGVGALALTARAAALVLWTLVLSSVELGSTGAGSMRPGKAFLTHVF